MSIAGDIIRRTQITGSNHANYQVSKDAWNDPLLVISSGAPDGALMMRDSAQANGWGFTTGPMLGMVPETRTINGHPLTGDLVITKADVGLGQVENIQLSTWGGSSFLATVGIITSGQWHATIIKGAYGGTGSPYVTLQGPTAPRLYTLPDQDATIFTTAAPIPPEYGGTGGTTGLTDLNAADLTHGIIPTARYGPEVVLRPFSISDLPAHAITHNTGGLDPITSLAADVLTSGVLALARLPPQVLLRPLPLADLPTHHDTHNYGGSDAITSLSATVITTGNLALPRLPLIGTTHLLGRASPGPGVPEELIIGPGLMLDGFTLIGIAGAGLPGGGDVFGPSSAGPDNFATFNGATGKVIRDSGISSVSLVRVDITNTFTAPQTFSGVAPSLTFIETDAAAEQRVWRLTANATQLQLQVLADDATVVLSSPVRLARDGTVTVSTLVGALVKATTLEALTFTPTTPNATAAAHGLLPALSGVPVQFLDGTGAWTVPPLSAGDVVGPASAINNEIPLFSGTTGKLLKSSSLLLTQFARVDQSNAFAADNVFAGQVQINTAAVPGALLITSPTAGAGRIVLNETAGANCFPGIYMQVRGISKGGMFWTEADAALVFYIWAAPSPVVLALNTAGATLYGPLTQTRLSDTTLGWNVYTTAPIYPGQIDVGWQKQTSWFLASHAAYGLYSNTGLRLDGNLSVAGSVGLGTTTFSGYIYPWNIATPAPQSTYFLAYHSGYPGAGAMYINADLATGGRLLPAGVVYPGSITSGSWQASYYLASHSSYGLYTNTGLYVSQNLWVAVVSYLSDIECRNIYQTNGWLYPANISTGARQLSYFLGYHASYAGLYTNGSWTVGAAMQCGGYIYPGATTNPGVIQQTWFLASHSTYGIYTNTGLYTAGSFVCASQISAAGFVYPGHGGSLQSSFYLSANSTYGIYINTGLYTEGGSYPAFVEARAHVRAAGGLYDYGRGYPICVPQAVDPATYFTGPSVSVSTQAMSYARAGKMMFINFFLNGTLNATSAGAFGLTLPEGASFFQSGQLSINVFANGQWEHGLASYTANQTFFTIYRDHLVEFPNGLIYLVLTGWVPIN